MTDRPPEADGDPADANIEGSVDSNVDAESSADQPHAGTLVFDADAPPPPRTGPRRAEAVAAIKPGALLGRFEIIQRLGGGGMGEVFLARDPDLDRDVAIKVLSGPAAADPKARVRFLLEGRAAGRVSHPNIVAIHEVGPTHLADSVAAAHGDDGPPPGELPKGADVTDGPVYLVMDYSRDGSVDQLLKAGPLSTERATAVLADAAAGLAAAHAAGLVHRDVKPANLMLEGGGPWSGGAVKVTDFGLARRVADAAEDSSEDSLAAPSSGEEPRTARRKVVGTPHYMSPEQCRGGAVDARSDLYSLGATYFTLLAGRPPFAAGSGAPPRPVTAVLNAHKQTDPPPVHTLDHLDGGVPEACSRIIVRAMAKDPKDRYPGAAALRADALALLAALREHAAAEPAGEVMRDRHRFAPRPASSPSLLPKDFLLPSERPGTSGSYYAASDSWSQDTGVANGSGVHDPAAATPAEGSGVKAVSDGDLPAARLMPPPGVRREIFSLSDGEVLLSYPATLKEASLTEEEIDRLRAWLNLVRVKMMALAEERPKQPPG
ncbi:serine/threonine-protein kinase [Alienimonas chondri]|uniref:Serine/threonine-protein kinase PknD n=1 Tax=Alienimonas chondri TaxID=2681879 RepID=A0ABX1VGK9_9PLAN|nr:serine/threonine-protein kinase [Alienimonas chondri]NNJ27264.1 Serine/threonine-protein kinase PknD [Alienimonas chondri]